jgi:hypothetical protein
VQGKKALPEGGKVAFAAITGRTRGRGIFGIEEEGEEVARQAKLQRMAERGLLRMIAGMRGIGGGARSVGTGRSTKGMRAAR